MTGPVVRFVQAANLKLDFPLRGIGKQHRNDLDTIRDASFRAYENLVNCCIDGQVDFLLFCGNCFHADDRSLPAQVALLHGLEKLNDHGIKVVVAPGAGDPLTAWTRLPSLPENVTLLHPNEPSVLLEFGQNLTVVKVSLDLDEMKEIDEQNEEIFRLLVSRNDEPFSPQIAERSLNSTAFDYFAIGGSGQRQTFSNGVRTIHHSGSMVPIEKSSLGPHGASLVELDENRNPQFRFFNVSPVRREHEKIEIVGEQSWEDVWTQIRKYAETIVARKTNSPCEKVCLIDWSFVDSSMFTRGMQVEELIEKIGSLFCDQFPQFDRHDFVHAVEIRYPEIESSSSAEENKELHEYWKILDQIEDSMQGNLNDYFRENVAEEEPWTPHLQQFIDGISLEEVFSAARQKGFEDLSNDGTS